MPQTNDIQNNGPLFVDANVFLRFLTNDVPDQAAIVEDLFHRAAAGELHLVTNATVLAELVWVLESFYGLPRPDVQERAMAVAQMQGLSLPEADVVTDALLAYARHNVDYTDAFNAKWMAAHGLTKVVTFDEKHFSRFEEIEVQRF